MDTLITGIPSIDAEHKWIADTLRGLRLTVDSSSDSSAIRRTIGILVDAFIEHCSSEERIAAEAGVDEATVRKLKAQHAHIRSQLDDLKRGLGVTAFPCNDLNEMIDDLHAKMLDHFSSVDVPLLSKRGHGGIKQAPKL